MALDRTGGREWNSMKKKTAERCGQMLPPTPHHAPSVWSKRCKIASVLRAQTRVTKSTVPLEPCTSNWFNTGIYWICSCGGPKDWDDWGSFMWASATQFNKSTSNPGLGPGHDPGGCHSPRVGHFLSYQLPGVDGVADMSSSLELLQECHPMSVQNRSLELRQLRKAGPSCKNISTKKIRSTKRLTTKSVSKCSWSKPTWMGVILHWPSISRFKSQQN